MRTVEELRRHIAKEIDYYAEFTRSDSRPEWLTNSIALLAAIDALNRKLHEARESSKGFESVANVNRGYAEEYLRERDAAIRERDQSARELRETFGAIRDTHVALGARHGQLITDAAIERVRERDAAVARASKAEASEQYASQTLGDCDAALGRAIRDRDNERARADVLARELADLKERHRDAAHEALDDVQRALAECKSRDEQVRAKAFGEAVAAVRAVGESYEESVTGCAAVADCTDAIKALAAQAPPEPKLAEVADVERITRLDGSRRANCRHCGAEQRRESVDPSPCVACGCPWEAPPEPPKATPDAGNLEFDCTICSARAVTMLAYCDACSDVPAVRLVADRRGYERGLLESIERCEFAAGVLAPLDSRGAAGARACVDELRKSAPSTRVLVEASELARLRNVARRAAAFVRDEAAQTCINGDDTTYCDLVGAVDGLDAPGEAGG